MTGYTTPRPVGRRGSMWLWVFVMLGIGVMVVSTNYVVRGILDKTHIASSSVFAVTPTASPVTQVTIVRETQIVERIVVVTATPEPQVATRQLPPPRQSQPAAWPAPAQPTVTPPPTMRPAVYETIEIWRCPDGYSYTPGAWDWLNGVYTEKQTNGSLDVLESGRGVGGNPLRHRNCQLQQTQKAR